MIKLKDIIFEQGSAGEEAKKRGLKSIGFGRYVDPAKPETVVAKSVNGKLVAIKGGKEKPTQKRSGPAAGKESTNQMSSSEMQSNLDYWRSQPVKTNADLAQKEKKIKDWTNRIKKATGKGPEIGTFGRA